MKNIKPSENPQQWPRKETPTIECRKRDLVVRIADWHKCKDASGYDVEVYISGVYDWNESQTFNTKALAAEFAAKQIAKLL